MKVLHLDSDSTFQRSLRGEMLRNGGILCDLEQYSGLDQALTRLGETAFDVVVVDPFDGANPGPAPRACEAIHAAAPATPIVALTNLENIELAVDSVLAGAHDYLHKSEAEPSWLLRRIRYAIERSKHGTTRIAAPHIHQHQRAPVHAAANAGIHEALRGHMNAYAPDRPESGLGTPSQPPANAPRSFSFQNLAPIQLLHVEDDSTIARVVKKWLSRYAPYQFQVTHCANWGAALDALKSRPFDIILLDLTLPDQQGMDCIHGMLPHAAGAPLLVLSGRDDDLFALETLHVGAEDFLIKGDVNVRYLGRATLLSLARQARAAQVAQESAADAHSTGPVRSEIPDAQRAGQHEPTHLAVDQPDPQARNAPRSAGQHDRRKHARYILTKPVFVIPILPDRSPGESHTADGVTVDLSAGGLKVEVGGIDRLPTKHLLLGVENNSNAMHYVTVEARHVVPLPGRLSIGTEFVSDSRDLLRRANLEPTFNPATRCFETGLSLEVLARWCELGCFRPVLVDRVLLCPQCQAVATFRKGCRVCGSVRLHSRPLIHHFACAHVGFVGDFEQDGTVVCPKCRTKNMIVGADYEHLSGPFRCLDCDWSDTELDLVGQCLRCELRFPATQAVEEDLIGYHVERLDPVAFLNAT